jgi:hypothetical protein
MEFNNWRSHCLAAHFEVSLILGCGGNFPILPGGAWDYPGLNFRGIVKL